MARRRLGLGGWITAACAAGIGVACSSPNAILIGQIPDGASGSLPGIDAASPGSSGAEGDATTGNGSGGTGGGSSGAGGGQDGSSIDATLSGSSSGSGASSGAGSSGSAGGGSGSSSGASSSGSAGSSGSSSGTGSSGGSSSGNCLNCCINCMGGSSSGGYGSSSGGSSGSSSGGSSSGSSSSSGGGNGCDSGGPLAFKSVWSMPSVTPSSMGVDALGDVYVAGLFQGMVTFGTTTLNGPTTTANENMFLVKYSSAGSVLWARQFGATTGIYVGPMIAVDGQGNVFMGGDFNGTLYFGGQTQTLVAITLDAFAAKISAGGTTLWADHFGYNGGGYAVTSVAVGPDDNPVFAGEAGGTIVLGSTTWTAPWQTTQPWLAKLSGTLGTVIWSNASGGNIKSGEDIWVAVDASNRVFLAARVDSGGGSWGVEPEAGASTFDTMRAGFDANGNIMWGQWDYGAFPVAAAIDSAGRFNVLENASGTVTVGGTSTFNVNGGWDTLSVLFSPTDGSLLSGVNITDTFTSPNGGCVDAHGNAFVTGTYWPTSGSISYSGSSFVASGNSGDHPVFVAATDGLSHGVGGATLGGSNNAQPLAMAADSQSGNVYVAMTNPASFTSSVGTLAAGTYLAIFSPDPCADGNGPSGASTGTAGNHGDLGPDGGSPYVAVDAGAPAACPTDAGAAVNGAACPVARGCPYSPNECCFCSPTPCGDASTTWTCESVANGTGCPSSLPNPGTACGSSTSLSCYYCTIDGRIVAQCTVGGWETLVSQTICQ